MEAAKSLYFRNRHGLYVGAIALGLMVIFLRNGRILLAVNRWDIPNLENSELPDYPAAIAEFTRGMMVKGANAKKIGGQRTPRGL